MLLKNLKRRLYEAEERLTRIDGELKEIREALKRESRADPQEEISCAGLIDEWVNGREEN